MTGFEPQISGVRSKRSTNCATTTAQNWLFLVFDWARLIFVFLREEIAS